MSTESMRSETPHQLSQHVLKLQINFFNAEFVIFLKVVEFTNIFKI
jgi:hypothetical protein